MCASFHSPKKNISQECAFLYLKLIPTESLKLLMLFETFKYDLMIIRNNLYRYFFFNYQREKMFYLYIDKCLNYAI